MKHKNTIYKTFGPAGSFAGFIILISGLFLSYYSFFAIILILFGLFIGFTAQKAQIDPDKKRIKVSTNYFGLINTGKWININSAMKLMIKGYNQVYRTYSRSNRVLDIKNEDYLLFLFDSEKKAEIPVKRTKTLQSAMEEGEKLQKELGLDILYL